MEYPTAVQDSQSKSTLFSSTIVQVKIHTKKAFLWCENMSGLLEQPSLLLTLLQLGQFEQPSWHSRGDILCATLVSRAGFWIFFETPLIIVINELEQISICVSETSLRGLHSQDLLQRLKPFSTGSKQRVKTPEMAPRHFRGHFWTSWNGLSLRKRS